jgi:hypothetical protein
MKTSSYMKIDKTAINKYDIKIIPISFPSRDFFVKFIIDTHDDHIFFFSGFRANIRIKRVFSAKKSSKITQVERTNKSVYYHT